MIKEMLQLLMKTLIQSLSPNALNVLVRIEYVCILCILYVAGNSNNILCRDCETDTKFYNKEEIILNEFITLVQTHLKEHSYFKR